MHCCMLGDKNICTFTYGYPSFMCFKFNYEHLKIFVGSHLTQKNVS